MNQRQMPEHQSVAAVANRISGEFKTSAHVIMLEPGVYIVSRMTGSHLIDAASGLPDIRVSKAPVSQEGCEVEVVGLRPDGWVRDGAALIRVTGAVSPILITIYQRPGATEPAPRIQVQQIASSGANAADSPATQTEPARKAEVAAHIQRRGDVVGALTEWMGEPGSQRWIEGFSLVPNGIAPGDIEYQAVLGRGWLSPWSENGQYCGSRGMALPILGLRVRLKGAAATTHTLRVSASFTDGTRIGPVGAAETCEAESLASLEAFRVELIPISTGPENSSLAAPANGAAEKAILARRKGAPRKTELAFKSKAVKSPVASGRE